MATYWQIASLIPPPSEVDLGDYRVWGARWVGSALALCPQDVPWQRVVNAQGKISLRQARQQQIQRALLEAEGVVFDERWRINLEFFGWSESE